jgi:hypothetical protein
MIGLVAGVGYAVFTLTRLAKDASPDQFDDYTPTPATPGPARHEDEKPDEQAPDEKKSPGTVKPQSNQWGINPPTQRTPDAP